MEKASIEEQKERQKIGGEKSVQSEML